MVLTTERLLRSAVVLTALLHTQANCFTLPIQAGTLPLDDFSAPSDDCPVASTGQTLYQGTHLNDEVTAFLGVPFAQPPVGDLRFRPPQPLSAPAVDEHKIVDASNFGPVCHQFHYGTVLLNNTLETTRQSEDCLNLNIFRPRNSSNSKPLPSLLWAYGGGFVEGGGSMPLFNAKNLVASQGDIIVVTFNVRGTIFGYPNTPALPLDQQNLGIRDQRAALEWLRDNIAYFGGDPMQITVGGQSSGADGWAALAYAYPDDYIARGLLLESGHELAAEPSGDTTAEWHRIAKTVGCRNKSDGVAELECMKTVPAQTLRDAISPNFINMFAVPNGGTPMIDNITLFTPDEYLKRGNAGRFAKVPLFLGLNNREGDGIQNFSPECGVNSTFSDIITFAFFECPMALEASYRTMHSVPTWRYRYFGKFAADTFFPWLGPYHAAEVAFVLGSYVDLKPSGRISSNEHAAAKMLQDAVGAFVRDPQAGLSNELNWPMYDPHNRTLVELFRGNQPQYELADPQKYYSGCDNPPSISWAQVAAPPPKC